MKEKAKKLIKYIASLAVAALCIYLVINKVEWASFWDGLMQTRWGYIVLFIIVSIFALVFRSLRWRLLLLPFDPKVKMINTWNAITVGEVANIAMPGAGEIIRCGMMSSGRMSFDKGFGTIVMERMWDALMIMIMLVISLAVKKEELTRFIMGSMSASSSVLNLWLIALIAILALCVFLIFRFRTRVPLFEKFANFILGLKQGFISFFKMQRKLEFIIYTLLIWLMYVLMSYFGLKAVPVLSDLNFVDALFISAIGNIATVFPVPSGMGPFHYLVTLCLGTLYGISQEIGLLYAVLCHETHSILLFILGAVSYLCYTASKNSRKKANS